MVGSSRDVRWIALVLSALALVACSESAAPVQPVDTARRWGAIAFKPCSLVSPFATGSVEAQCATWRVAENPAAPKGRQIDLNIAWLPATDEGNADADPVVFLAGGPGQAATETWPLVDPAFTAVRKRRNVLLIDQRGTGKSHPLICRDGEGGSAVVDRRNATLEGAVEFARTCAAGLDADPRYYTTTDAVRDLESVRAAVGAETLNVIGVSYGTRVAQRFAATHPTRVRTLVLDSVVPNTLVLGTEHARNLDVALGQQFARCRSSATCSKRFGSDMDAQLRGLMAKLKDAPVEVDYADPMTGESRRETATSDTVAGLTRMFSYGPQAAALLPMVLSEAQAGRYGPLMALSQLISAQMSESIMHGMQLSVICSEDADLFAADPKDGDTVLGTGLSDVLLAQCKAWPKGMRPKDFHTPLTSKVPTLLMSGEFDPVTPARYGDDVATTLPNSRHLVLRGQGHNVVGVGCMPKLLAKFMETADAKALDAACLKTVDYVPPFTGFNGWEP